ncbi:hypothetical protein FMH17_08610, partial [Vibrio vulnificus]|nr:hypothetical protein [Vibrio vulnificus]
MLKVVNAIAYRGTPPTDEQKEKDEKNWNFTSGAAWDVSSEKVGEFVRKSNAKIQDSYKEYSTFKPLDIASPKEFPCLLKKYLENSSLTAFEQFHRDYVKHRLTSNLSRSSLKEGAVVVFVHYQTYTDPKVTLSETGEEIEEANFVRELIADKFLVIMVRNTDALKFTEDLQISSTDVIDLKQFVQGCLVDNMRFTKWTHDSTVNEEEDDKSDSKSSVNFLAFVKGSADIRDYFKEAMYAEAGITNKLSSQNLKTAFEDFCEEHDDLPRAVTDSLEQKLYNLSQEYKKTPVTLEFIGLALDSCFPDEFAEYRGAFVKFANEGHYEINDSFEFASTIMKDFMFVDLEVPFGTLRLTKESIGGLEDNRAVVFDSNTNMLILSTT